MLSLKQAMSVLEKNHIFGIFPEGRRSLTGELDSFEKGAAFLALRCNSPIIPIYADPNWKKRGRVRMVVGESIDPNEVAKTYAGRGVDAVTDAIRDSLQELKNELERMP
jgi:1-acyl-sn-glycerol-3-phosphate acyltransferase